MGPSRRESDPDASTRRVLATISAATDSAISAGFIAPMSNPAGPWIAASCAGDVPLANIQSRRRVWVRRDPMAPT